MTQTEGLSGFGTVSAGILAGAFYADSQQLEDELSGTAPAETDWMETMQTFGTFAVQFAADFAGHMYNKGMLGPFASMTLGVVGAIIEEDDLDKDEVENMISEALRRAKDEWKQEVLRETRGIVKDRSCKTFDRRWLT